MEGYSMENNENIIIFTDDDGNDLELEHLDTIELDAKVYIVCVPAPTEEEEEIEEVIIFEAMKDAAGEDGFVQVDDDGVLENVYHEFINRNEDMFDFED